MNSLTRALTKIATLQSQQASRRPFALQSFSASSTTSQTLTKPKKPAASNPSEAPKEWPKPTEIPYQSKVANSVRLSGYIHIPVQFKAASDGKFWAGTVIAQNPSSDPPLWIPIIFEGDLAHIAACHLKENDHVYIDGQLTADPPSPNVSGGQANVQVMVRTVNFVDESPTNKSISSHKQEGTLSHSASTEKGTKTASSSWMDLLDNPQEWKDYREKKLLGLVKPKYPDFKRKDGALSLWLDSAPKPVLSKLEGLQFDVSIKQSKQVNQHKGEGSWRDLVENPSKWWDNRLEKLNGKVSEKYPDFKHKETGEALWLSSSPGWVEPKLPPLKSKKWSENSLKE